MGMVRQRFSRLAISAGIALGSAGAITLAGSGVANAASYTCVGGNPVSYCIAHVYSGAVLYKSSGGTIHLNSNESVKITCWYYGNTGDGYWDHVTWTAQNGNVTGHVDDDYVDLNHQPPPAVHLRECS